MYDNLMYAIHGGMFAIYLNYAVCLLLKKTDSKSLKRIYRIAGVLMAAIFVQTCIWFIFKNMEVGAIIYYKEMTAMINASIIPFLAVLLIEISRMAKVTVLFLLKHLFPFLAFVFLCAISYDISWLNTRVIFIAFLVFTSAYIVYHIHAIYKSIKVYSRNLNDIYANHEGRSLNWITSLIILVIIGAVIYYILQIFTGGPIAKAAFSVFITVFWVILIKMVEQMKGSDLIPEMTAEKELEDHTKYDSEELDEFIAALRTVIIDEQLYSCETLTRDDVAKELGTNHTTLTKKLKDATGMTFSAYIGSIRIAQATKMLLETTDTVELISLRCGYKTKSTFYRAFAEVYHCTPAEYRKYNS